jgi:DNA replication and repair protein RecF
MYLKNLQVRQFKSYAEAQFEFIPNINCIVGENGKGKTNLLDAIYFLSMTKSVRSMSDQLCVLHGEEFFSIQGKYVVSDLVTHITCSYQKGHKKQVFREQKAYPRLADHIGNYPVVMMDPYDTDLIREGSEERRRFFDSMMSQKDRTFLDKLLSYNRVLQQRNSLLKAFAERNMVDHLHLETYDKVLVGLGEELSLMRKAFLKEYIPAFQKHYANLSEGRETVNIALECNFEEGKMGEALKQHLSQDLAAQRTGVGIHKDEFLFEIDGYLLKKFGSQGQQKSFVVALKLAQFDLLWSDTHKKPILLLDDIFDKLDDRRIQRLIQMMAEEHFGQVFITDARPERTKSLLKNLSGEIKYFEI